MRQRIIALWQNEYIQGGVFLVLASLVVNILNYFFNFFAGRVLGPNGYGELITYFSYIAILSVPMLVLSTIIIQKISSHTENQKEYAISIIKKFNGVTVRISPFLLIFLVLIPVMPRITNLSNIVAYLIIPAVALGLVTSFYQSIMQGMRYFLMFAVMSIIVVIFKFISILFPLFKLSDIGGVVNFQFVSTVVILYVFIRIINDRLQSRRMSDQKFHTAATIRNFVMSNQFFITLVSVLAVTALSTIDIIFVKKFFSATEAGLYSSWSLFAKIILYVIGPLAQIGLVFFASNQHRRLQERALLLSLFLLLIVGIAGYIAYSTVGNILISLLFGNKFIRIAQYLGLAALFGTGYAAVTFLNTYFLAKKSIVSVFLGLLMPFYILALFFVPKQLVYIMYINIIFCAVATAAYLFAFFMEKKTSNV